MKAVICLDKWKRKFFEKVLDREGFEYEVFGGDSDPFLTIQVETPSAKQLFPFVLEADNAAVRSKMN